MNQTANLWRCDVKDEGKIAYRGAAYRTSQAWLGVSQEADLCFPWSFSKPPSIIMN